LHNCKQKKEEINIDNVCASFQKAAITSLIQRTKLAMKDKKYKTLILAGGVSANSLLRKEFLKLHPNAIIPKLEYCTDNAAMIASACYIQNR
jgi:N6-L-threonylcarbamoyladenine synthase